MARAAQAKGFRVTSATLTPGAAGLPAVLTGASLCAVRRSGPRVPPVHVHEAWGPTAQGCVTRTHFGPTSPATSTSHVTQCSGCSGGKTEARRVQQWPGGMAWMPRSTGHQEARMRPSAWTRSSSRAVRACQRGHRGRGSGAGAREGQGPLTSHTLRASETPTPRPQELPHALPSITSAFWNILMISPASIVGVTVPLLSTPGSGQTGTTEHPSWKKPPRRQGPPSPVPR